MIHEKHAPFLENIPAYAIGALDADDVAALEAHLEECVSCRAELAEYRAMSESLLAAIPPRQPSAMLRRRLQSQLPSAQKKNSPKFTWNVYRFGAGIAVIALLALNLVSLNQTRKIQTQQAALVNQMNDAQVALAMLSYPGVERLSVEGEDLTGSYLLDGDRNIAVLIVWNMPQLSQDQTYQAWLIDPQGGRVSAGIFRPQTNQAYTTQVITTDKGFSTYIGIGVTVEPSGGSVQPTGERVLKVDF
jgi:anti-sigma-K factor RskA